MLYTIFRNLSGDEVGRQGIFLEKKFGHFWVVTPVMSEAARAGQKGIDSSFGIGGHGSSSWEKWEQFGDATFSFATEAISWLSLRRRGHLTIFFQWLQETCLQQPTRILLVKENVNGNLKRVRQVFSDQTWKHEREDLRSFSSLACSVSSAFEGSTTSPGMSDRWPGHFPSPAESMLAAGGRFPATTEKKRWSSGQDDEEKDNRLPPSQMRRQRHQTAPTSPTKNYRGHQRQTNCQYLSDQPLPLPTRRVSPLKNGQISSPKECPAGQPRPQTNFRRSCIIVRIECYVNNRYNNELFC